MLLHTYVHTSQHMSSIHCAICSKQVLIACLLNQYKQTGGSTQKHTYSLEWLQTFFTSSALLNVCKSCRVLQQKSHDTIMYFSRKF